MGALPPVSPADFESAEVKPGDRACDVISKLSTLSRLSAEWFRWMMNDDQTPTRDYLDWAGAAGGTGLDAPSNVAATSNSTTKVTVTWGSVEGATAYRVFRGLTADTRLMQQIGDELTTTSFEDTTGDTDVVYFYAVKAFNATLTSGFSGTAQGKKVSSTAPEDEVVEDYSEATLKTITVPEGKDRMEIELWGGGGKGGDGPEGSWVPVAPGGSTPQPGGGGASGSYYHRTAIPVTAGESFQLVPGGPGEDTRINRVADGTFARATKGGNGGTGSYSVSDPGDPGAPASSAGSISFSPAGDAGVGTTVGNAGDGQYGGAAVVDVEGYERGKGGDGATTTGGDGSLGNGGRIRVKFTTAA